MNAKRKSTGLVGRGSLGLLCLLGATHCGAPEAGSEESVSQAVQAGADALKVPVVQSVAELARMRKYLEERYPAQAVVHQFRSALGDKIDCVRMEAQPGLRREGMQRHVLQRAPRTLPQGEPVDTFGARGLNPSQGLTHGVDAAGALQHCPEGAIPVLRLELEDLQRFSSLDDFFRKEPVGSDPRSGLEQAANPLAAGPTSSHQYAHAAKYNVDNRGATSTLNLWNPAVELSREFSLSQIWVTRGSGSNLETVETGMQLYKDLYGDNTSHLFIYYTPDGYKTGCYNLSCSAFVQTDNSVVVGGSLGGGSVRGGTQYEQRLEWFKDGPTGPWWLRFGSTWVGYYPVSLFDSNGLATKASNIDFGGEIIDGRNGGRHTATDMGSGAYASEGWQKAAFQRRIQYVDTNNVYQTPALSAYRDSAGCYDIALFNDTSANGWGQHFYFGGPGYNANCT
ncbi:MAG: neprosin family prolyl endopeptidase [Cystobacter sp.]